MRPTNNTINLKPVIEKIALDVNKWCNNETSIEDISESLEKILEYNYDEDGYYLAKEFEDEGYTSDSELVEILDCTYSLVREQLKAEIKEWVIKENIKPKLKIGDLVKLTYKRKSCEGEIITIYDDVAQYTVCIESEGHVKFGIGTHGTIVDFETIEL